MRVREGRLCFSPKLPPGIVGLSFRLRYRGRVLLVSIHDHTATYSLLAGDPLDVTHHGQPVTVTDKELVLDTPIPVQLPPPSQPPGRVPQSHRARAV
jgi:alpha,alpha-trehalose phosphorylase